MPAKKFYYGLRGQPRISAYREKDYEIGDDYSGDKYFRVFRNQVTDRQMIMVDDCNDRQFGLK